VLVYGYYDFRKPSVHGFPTPDDPADRSCRYNLKFEIVYNNTSKNRLLSLGPPFAMLNLLLDFYA
jgi:hypothetical protein